MEVQNGHVLICSLAYVRPNWPASISTYHNLPYSFRTPNFRNNLSNPTLPRTPKSRCFLPLPRSSRRAFSSATISFELKENTKGIGHHAVCMLVSLMLYVLLPYTFAALTPPNINLLLLATVTAAAAAAATGCLAHVCAC